MSTSVLGKASIIKVSISASLTAIPNCTSVSGIPATGTKVDTTALSDTTVQCKTGIPDLGDYKIKLNHDPSNAVHQYLQASQKTASGTAESFEHTYPNSGPNKETFSGPVVDYNVGSVDRNGVYSADISIHVNSNAST
jgi:hypothetical protein